MKDFTRAPGRLASLPVPARAVYSIFLLFTLAGLGMSLWLTERMVGLDLHELEVYYAGSDDPARGTPLPVPLEGPLLDLPDDAVPVALAEPMPLRKLLEVTHFHLFSMPLYLLILSHLFMLGRASDRTKLLWIALGTLGVAGHIAAPWLARTGAASSALLYGTTGAILLIAFLVMSLWALWEMWVRAPASR